MFDGNHRIRRNVNMGGRSRATAQQRTRGGGGGLQQGATAMPSSSSSSSKASILEQSRRQREARAARQRRIQAAKCAQRHVRGHQSRQRLQQKLYEALLLTTGQKQQPSRTLLALETTQLNVWLRLAKRRTTTLSSSDDVTVTTKRLLLHYTSRLPLALKETGGNNEQKPMVLQHEILKAAMQQMMLDQDNNSNSAAEEATCWETIIQYFLSTVSSANTNNNTSAAMMDVDNNNYHDPTTPVAFSNWTYGGGLSGVELAAQVWQQALTAPHQSEKRRKLMWSLLQNVVPETHAGHAFLGALLWTRPLPLAVQTSTVENDIPEHHFLPLASVLTTTSETATNTAMEMNNISREQALARATQRWVQGREVALLFLALRASTGDGDNDSNKNNNNASWGCSLPPAAIPVVVQLTHAMMERRPLLVCLAGLVARGEECRPDESAVAAAARVAASPDAAATADREDDSDSDDDDDDDSNKNNRAGTKKAARVTTTSRWTKQDLLTLPKLDRKAQEARTQWKRNLLGNATTTISSTNLDTTRALAKQLGQPALWLRWSEALFLASPPHETEDLSQARQAYVAALAMLLRASGTGLQPRTSGAFPLLTSLAFSPRFLDGLWRYIIMCTSNQYDITITYAALSVFCDVFAHNLVALKDDAFLERHTTMQGASRVILAEHVIGQVLRPILYDLYWVKPVRVGEVQAAYDNNNETLSSQSEDSAAEAALALARGRLLLTGTKLWNALYERWCRLVRHAPFCDESTWWFPTMTTLSGDAAVRVSSARNDGAAQDDEDDAMQVDSEDDEEDEQPASAADAESDALAEAFSDPRMARILTCIPQTLPFDRRVKLFDSLIRTDKLRTQDERADMQDALRAMMEGHESPFGSGRAKVEIHRDRLYEDSMQQLNKLGPKLKRKIQVSFINQHGAQEAGIDGGGVFKEFVDDLIRDAFSVNQKTTASHQLFTVTPLETLAVNGAMTRDPSLLIHYEFLGRAIGKAVYESILVEPQFCLPFLNQLLGKSNYIEDLKNFDPEYYKNLTKLLSLSAEDIDNLGLAFELSLSPSADTVALVPGGANKPVTKQNVIQYVHLVAHQRLNVQGAPQVRAFLRGFRDLIPASWVRLFSAYELQKLISGDDSVRGIDVASFRNSMQYAAGYHPSQVLVQWFWDIVDEMSAEQQRKLLKFMTSCSRQPLLGFSSLEPAPCIQQIRLPHHIFTAENLSEEEIVKRVPLPTSSTCMNLLKLPDYPSKEIMRKKLVAAIESGAGFELT